MRKDSFQTFKKLIKTRDNFVIVTHWSPDGDAIGSSLGLFHFLRKLKKKVRVIVPNEYPEFLNWMPGNNQVLNFQEKEAKCLDIINSAELIFTLDFNSFKRLEKLGHFLEKTKAPKVLIDHHPQPDTYASYYFHDASACSTCELVYDLIAGMGGSSLIDKKIASCLYTGIMTDTGSFKYPSVTSRTHAIIADLLKTGIVPNVIHSAVYDSYSLSRLKLLGFALNDKLKLVDGLPVSYFTLSEKELKKYNYEKGDLEGLVNYPFSIKGIQLCALLNETESLVKISFRSKGKLDVNEYARKYFSGGGHKNAAGGKSKESLAATEALFVESIKTLF